MDAGSFGCHEYGLVLVLILAAGVPRRSGPGRTARCSVRWSSGRHRGQRRLSDPRVQGRRRVVVLLIMLEGVRRACSAPEPDEGRPGHPRGCRRSSGGEVEDQSVPTGGPPSVMVREPVRPVGRTAAAMQQRHDEKRDDVLVQRERGQIRRP